MDSYGNSRTGSSKQHRTQRRMVAKEHRSQRRIHTKVANLRQQPKTEKKIIKKTHTKTIPQNNEQHDTANLFLQSYRIVRDGSVYYLWCRGGWSQERTKYGFGSLNYLNDGKLYSDI